MIETYLTQTKNLAIRILGDWALAEDATQEAFLSGYRAFRSFRGGNLRAWLLKIVANACRDSLRVKKTRPVASLDFSPTEPEGQSGNLAFDPPSPDESPEDHAVRSELSGTIQRGLDSIPEERRLAVTLVDVQGFSYEEASQVIGCSLGTVKSRIARGRAEIRDFLREHQELLPQQFRLTK